MEITSPWAGVRLHISDPLHTLQWQEPYALGHPFLVFIVTKSKVHGNWVLFFVGIPGY